MRCISFLCLGSALLLAGCSSVSVSRDYDVSYDFSSLKTFAWQHAEQPRTGIPRIDNDLNDQRIRSAVVEALEAKGFSQADNKAAAGFLVAYFIDFQQRIEGGGGSFSVGLGRTTGAGIGTLGWGTGSDVSDYEEVHLTIDFLDTATEKTVWRGRGRRRASGSDDPEKLTKKTNDVVQRVLNKFPPK